MPPPQGGPAATKGAAGRPDLERVLRFVVVADELSFTRAAIRLGVDQAWLSRQIQQLELQLGFALFHRSTRTVELSAEGRAFLDQARAFATAAEDLIAGAAELARLQRREFRLGVAPFAFWVPPRQLIAERFRAAFGDSGFHVVSRPSARLLSELHKRTIDAAIIAGVAQDELLEQHVIYRHRPALLIPIGEKLADQASLHVSDLAGCRIAITEPRLTPSHDLIYGPLEAAGAIPVVIPEGRRAMHFYARRERMMFIEFGAADPAVDPPNFVRRSLAEMPTVPYVAVRRLDASGAAADLFWSLVLAVDADAGSRGDV